MGENKEYVVRQDDKGSINISEDVISVIAATAASEVEGVANLSTSPGKDLAEWLGKKNIAKGIRITVEGSSVTADVCLMVKIGYPLNEIAVKVQTNVKNAVESMTGLDVTAVNVNISGVAFDR